MWQSLLTVALLVSPVMSLTLKQETCSADRRRVGINTANAKVIFGGIFDIRDPGTGGTGCGEPNLELMQVYEAARWTINQMNSPSNTFTGGVSFGMEAYDTCGQMGNALNAAHQYYPQSAAANYSCSLTAPTAYKLGFIGPMQSDFSKAVASFAQTIPASVVSPRSGASELANKALYPTFLRTDYSNAVYAKAIVTMLKQIQRERIIIVYSDDSYGMGGYEEILKASLSSGICVSGRISVPHYGTVSQYQAKLQNIMSYGVSSVIFFGGTNDAFVTMQAIQAIVTTNAAVGSLKWFFSELEPGREAEYATLTAAQGAVSGIPTVTTLSSFRTYFTALNVNNPPADNPWLQDWYMRKYRCSFPGATYTSYTQSCSGVTDSRAQDFKQSPYVEATVIAMYAYVQAMRTVCGTTNLLSCVSNNWGSYSPLDFHNILKKVDFTFPNDFIIDELRGRRVAFDLNGDLITSAFTFYNFNNNGGSYAMQQFATYQNGMLSKTSDPVPTASSLCPTSGCSNCLRPTQGMTLAYKNGDIVVAALVDAHDPDSTGMSCGTVIPDRLVEAVAVRFQADRSSDSTLSVGYLIVDVCPGMEMAQSFLTSLFGGFYVYMDSAGNIIDTTNIVAVLDMTREDTARKIAPILQSQGLPHIRVAPTSRPLLDSDMFTNIISAVPSRDNVSLAIIQMLNAVGWKYVQIVSESEGSYYDAAESFRRLASQHGVCVALWSTFDMIPVNTVNYMRSIQGAPVVIVFGNANRMRSLLKEVDAMVMAGAGRMLTFIGTEELGKSDRMLAGYNGEGYIALQLVEERNAAFDQMLDAMTSSDIASDPFLAEWFETKYSCSLNSATRGKYPTVCVSTQTIGPNEVYQGYSSYAIAAVISVAERVKQLRTNNCPGTTTGLCSGFRSLGNIGEFILNYMNATNLNTEYDILNGEGLSDLSYWYYSSNSFSSVGRFDGTSKRLINAPVLGSNANQVRLVNGSAVATQCTGRCGQCLAAYDYQQLSMLPGDFLIGGTFALRDPGPDTQRPYICGSVRTDSRSGIQYSTAMLFALQQINNGMAPVKLQNLTLGGVILDHCNNARRAYGQVSDIYSGLVELKQQMMPTDDMMHFVSKDILAWLTDNTASTKEAAEILQPLRIGIVSPSATSASLMDNPTFFRTIQGDGTTAMAIVKLCKTLGFSYLQVVHEANTYGRGGLETLTNTARQEGLCVINSVEMSSTADAQLAATTLSGSTSRVVVMYLGTTMSTAFLEKAAALPVNSRLTLISPEPFTSVVSSTANKVNLNNMLSLQLRNPTLANYAAFLNNPDLRGDPFFARYYMSLNRCNLPGYYMFTTDCTGQGMTIQQGDYVLSTVNAVYSVAQALHNTLVEFCGKDYVGQCAAFLQGDNAYSRFIEHLKVVKFTDPTNRQFQFIEREGNIIYNVLRYDGSAYSTIGSYGGASLVLDNQDTVKAMYSGVPSQCRAQCVECVFSGLSFSHTPGDIYLAGVFDVHSQGQGVFDCGAINTEQGFQLLEAFHFALQQVNSKQGIFANVLNGVSLGGVGLDACQSPIRGGYLVSNINNGLTTLVRDGQVIDPEEIDLYVGSYSSDSSIYLARILTDLKIPQISFAATSSTLKDQFFFPYFFRTVPADDKQVLGILNYLDNDDLRYVQLLYTDDSYGQQSVAQFELQRSQFSVCVAQKVVFPESGVVSEESSVDVVIKLLQKPVANTVVIFAGTDYIRAFLKAVERNSRAAQTFKFVGPTTWGIRETVTKGIRGVANEAVTFVLDFQGDAGGFLRNYLWQRTPSNAKNNPWFEEYFQEMLNCHTTPSNAARYPQACSPTASLETNVVEDNGILHVMNAVYSAAFALDQTLKEACGSNYQAVCEAYRNSKTRHDAIRDNLDDVNFTDPTNMDFHFVNRTGNKGYQIYKLVSSPTEDTEIVYNMARIGSFSSDDQLTMNMDLAPKYNGSCERKDACVECPTIRNRGTRFTIGGATKGKVTVVGVFDVHKAGSELYQCGDLNMEGFLQFLTFFWTYSSKNLQGVRLLALDTCSSPLRVGEELYSLLKDGRICNSEFWQEGAQPDFSMDNIGSVVVAGEENTVVASRVLEPLKVTYISPDAVSPLMDGSQYLLRARTPWSGFARLLANFLKNNGWTYINVVYVDSGNGDAQFKVLRQVAPSLGVCLGNTIAVADNAEDVNIRDSLGQLSDKSGARLILLLGTTPQVVNILRVAQSMGMSNSDGFLWLIGTDDPQFVNNIPQGLSFRALVLRPDVPTREKFAQHVQQLSFSNYATANIPQVWWEDFYQEAHMCRLTGPDVEYPSTKYATPCQANLTVMDPFTKSKLVHFSHLSSYFAMDGLLKFMQDCRAGLSVEDCLTQRNITRRVIRDDILSHTYDDPDTVSLYKWVHDLRFIQGNYNISYIDVRNGVVNEGENMLYRSYVDGAFNAQRQVINVVSRCEQADGCGCQQQSGAAAQAQTDKFSPGGPRNYFKYDGSGSQIYVWPVWTIPVCVLTCIGLLITILVFLYLLFAYPIKGGTSVLGFMTMIGIMGIYAINFAFFVSANDDTCGARRFLMGVVYMIVFAALLVKAIDNWRFDTETYSNQQYKGVTNPLMLFLIAVGIVLLQCIIPIEWLILVHPTASKWTNVQMHDYWWCDPPEMSDIGLVLSFIFVMFIILLTAIFAGLAWDSDCNNRESRWILVAAISTAGCFLVWMIVSTMAGPEYRDPAVAIANLVNASLILIFIPLRKLHLFCQSKNEKDQPAYQYDPYAYNNQTYDPDGEEYPYEGVEKSSDHQFD